MGESSHSGVFGDGDYSGGKGCEGIFRRENRCLIITKIEAIMIHDMFHIVNLMCKVPSSKSILELYLINIITSMIGINLLPL